MCLSGPDNIYIPNTPNLFLNTCTPLCLGGSTQNIIHCYDHDLSLQGKEDTIEMTDQLLQRDWPDLSTVIIFTSEKHERIGVMAASDDEPMSLEQQQKRWKRGVKKKIHNFLISSSKFKLFHCFIRLLVVQLNLMQLLIQLLPIILNLFLTEFQVLVLPTHILISYLKDY